MVASRIQTLRSSVTGNLPPSNSEAPGQLAVNWSDNKLYVLDPNGDAQFLADHILAYNSLLIYAIGDFVIESDRILRCNTAIGTPEAFDPTKWDIMGGINAQLAFVGLKATAGTIQEHEVLFISDWQASTQEPLVELADASNGSGLIPAGGIALAAFSNSVIGGVGISGVLRGIDTSAWSVADTLYVSATAGQLTNISPVPPDISQPVGTVLKVDASEGVIDYDFSVFGANVPANVTISETPPSAPLIGDLWWDNSDTDATMFIWYDDGNSVQWVPTSGGATSLAAVAENISYDNLASGLVADNVQDALDEIVVDLDTKIMDTLPAISGILTTTASLVKVAMWHPAMDEYSGWYDAVGDGVGPGTNKKSSFMVVEARQAAGDIGVVLYDMTVDPPLFISQAIITTRTLRSVDILGGTIVLTTNNGMYLWKWGPEGLPEFQGANRYDQLIVGGSNNRPATAGISFTDVKLGYTKKPTNNPLTGTPQVSIAYAEGAGGMGVVRDDGLGFFQATQDCENVAWMAGRIVWARNDGIPAIIKTIDVQQIIASSIIQDWESSALSTSSGSDNLRNLASNAVDLAARKNLSASVAAVGASVQRVTDLRNNTSPTNGLSAIITDLVNSGWMGQGTQGAWLADTATAGGAADRSGYARGMTTAGAVPEQAVATGAELKSYGNFNVNVHYHRVATPADFDPGTGPLFCAAWFKLATVTASAQYLISRGLEVGAPYYLLRVNANLLEFHMNTAASGNVIAVTPTTVDDDVWHMAVGVIESAGGDVVLYLDGVEIDRQDGSTLGTLNSVSALSIGAIGNGQNPFFGKLSLVRVAMGAQGIPDADQIRYMYETERRMFEDNAKITLQGATGACLSVDFDPVTDDYYVGQADGLNKFNGLVNDDFRLVVDPETWTSDSIEDISAVAGGMALVTANESYAEVPAIEVRDSLNKLIEAQNVSGPDMSVAKAWVHFVGSAPPSIKSSHNIKAVSRSSVGIYIVEFAVPFVDTSYIAVVAQEALATFTEHLYVQQTISNPKQMQFKNTGQEPPVNVDTSATYIVFYGQLEGE